MEDQIENVGMRIKRIMEDSQMSQQDFAKLTGISAASLSSIFNNRTRATNNHTLAIHQSFPNININWLLFGEGEMYSDGSTSDINQKASSQPSVLPSGDLFASSQRNTNKPSDPSSAYPSSMADVMPHLETVLKSVKNIDLPKRTIKEIRVFYSDGTYESFSPMK
ncbi:MAG: helix-turn-helix domain-containing protein [Bacteroidaceae bacterium]|nr:helix-turn-helix domain-containing protein [Bacteroidaceae bacterium]